MVLEKRRAKTTNRMDNVTLANKKNLVGTSCLHSELNRINREQVVEMRMHNNAHQRFKNKYPKLNIFDEGRDSEASDEVPLGPNNPGSSSSHNRECQPKASYIKSSSVNMQDLHILLFTDGEIDIDKLLCLYLLTAHKTETLRLPPKSQRVGYKARQLSPLERLIGRAKKRSARFKIFKTLPMFILDVPVQAPKKEPKQDPRLEEKVIVNMKIMRIVHSVKTALEACNPALLKRFMYLAHDRSRIENTMMQPKMDAFYKSLYGQNIISCCESFELEIMPANAISFRIDVEPLEEMIRLMRSNVLLVPNCRTWRSPGHSALCPTCTKPPTTECEDNLPSDAGPSTSKACASSILHSSENSDDMTPEPEKVQNAEPAAGASSTTCKLTKSDEEFFLNIEQYSDAEIDKRETMYKLQPKIMKNLQLGFSNMQLGEEENHQYTFDQDMSLEELAVLLDQKVKEEAFVDYQNLMEHLVPEPTDTDQTVVEEVRRPPLSATGSYSVKQTTCIACLKRWSEPMPTPKISKIKKFQLPKIGETSYYSSKSAQRISDLIDKQVRKIQQEEQTASLCTREENMTHRQLQRLAKGTRFDQTIEIIDLDEMDLARIRQEIRETETAKKLKKFFES